MSTPEHDPPPSHYNNVDLVYAYYAKKVLEESQKKYEEQTGGPIGGPLGLLSATTLHATELAEMDIPAAVNRWPERAQQAIASSLSSPPRQTFTIGILGAGVAGLYTALMIDSLGPNSGITYQILEANQRYGGRLYTHKFDGHTENDYYDVGAMRFPNIPIQQRTFKLFEYLKLSDQLIPYIMSNNKNDILYFNGVAMTVDQYNISSDPDPFNTQSGFNPKDAQEKFDKETGPFKQALKEDFDKGWKMLMEQDRHSMRSYLLSKDFSEPTVNWLETFDSSTAGFDRAFAESVMGSLMFSHDSNWFTLQGGSKVLVDALHATIKTKPEPGKRVTALEIDLKTVPEVSVTVDQESNPRVYDHVVSTLPFGCLRLVETGGCQMSFTLKQTIQCLQYSPSIKVAMRFSTRWWETGGRDHRGGVSRTDQPTRIVVYPSYGIDTSAATMLVSYSFTQDAQRTAAFIKGSKADNVVRDGILSDLAQMHNLPYKFLLDQYQDHHAWSWDNNEFSVGAFARFGPTQFRYMYPEITKPLHESLHFAGEACSVHHGWVVGALDSAYTTLLQLLVICKRPDLVLLLKEKWQVNELAEADETLALKQIVIGKIESARLKKRLDKLTRP